METIQSSPSKETGCCPRFATEPWNGKELIWDNKLFLKREVRAFFHIPLGFGKVISAAYKKLKDADAVTQSMLCLSDEKSAWGSDLLLESSKELPGEDMVRLSGTFITKVFEGQYKEIGHWVKEMGQYVESRGKKIDKLYFWYTTCPKCAKVYGKNHVVLVAKV